MLKRINIRIRNKTLVILIVIILFGFLLRIWSLNFQGLWHDELCSVVRASPSLSVGSILEIYQSDPHPPFHPLLLHYWMSVFGYHETSVRILSVLGGIIGIYAIFLLGRVVAGKQGGLIAAGVTAVNFFHLYYSREVRPYIFASLFSTLSFLFFLKLLKTPNKKNVLLYAIFSTLLIYTHYYGLIILLAQGAALLFYAVIDESCNKRRLFFHYGISGILILVLYSPWIPTAIKMLHKESHWNKLPKNSFFIYYFLEYFGDNSYLAILVAFVLLCLFIYLFLRAQGLELKRETESTIALEMEKAVPVLLFTIFFSLLIPYVRSVTTIPFLCSKYTILTFTLCIPLIAAGITLFRDRYLKSFIIATLLIVSSFNILGEKQVYTSVTKQQWREVVKEVIAFHPTVPSCTYLSLKNKQYQFYFTVNKSDIEVEYPRREIIVNILKKPPGSRNICILCNNGRNASKRFMRLIKRHFECYKKINYLNTGAEYYRIKERMGVNRGRSKIEKGKE